MLQLAQDMLKMLQDRVRTTLRVVADIAESVGVPPAVTSLLGAKGHADEVIGAESCWARPTATPGAQVVSRPAWGPTAPEKPVAEGDQPEGANHEAPGSEADRKRTGGRRRGLQGSVDLSDRVRPLRVDDEVRGSTYLARIIWSLGVAELEGTGPLRPADMARMIMSRSAVSLEPPNVARYIRRSKPTCVEVAHAEGSSNFYKLNAEGMALFEEMFGAGK